MENTSKPMVVWEKWIDPILGGEYQDIHETLDDMLKQPSFENDLEPQDTEDIDEDQLDNTETFMHKQQIKAIVTPMGLIPYDEHNAASRSFNFWTGHTNFNLSAPVAKIIEHADGVETLDIFTRYRFRISVGKLFKPSDVMSEISFNITKYIDEHY